MRERKDTEKRELETKIEQQDERHEHLRARNPEPYSAPVGEGIMANPIWKYGFLAVILALILLNIGILFRYKDYAVDNRYGNLMVGLGLLFYHIAFSLIPKGWKGTAMKIFACVWIVFVLIYQFSLLL